jgi:hypothetical protein
MRYLLTLPETFFFFHPPYGPDLGPVIFTCSHTWKQFLGDMHIGSNEEVKKTVKDSFSGLVADFYDADIQKLVTRYDKCLSIHGDYVEK